jgi:chemotaxis protein CheC
MIQHDTWEAFKDAATLDTLLPSAMGHAAAGLSEMVGRAIKIDVPRIEVVPLGQVATYAGGAETEMVGIYLLIEGDMPGQAILMLSQKDALHLVDLLMGVPTNTTTDLGEIEKSALAEAGNLTVSFFLNEVASLTGASSRPSPPAVMIDMLGAIVSVVTAPIAATSDDLLIVETLFSESARTVQVHFWVLPYPTTDDGLDA